MWVPGAGDPSHLTQSPPSQQMHQELLALRPLGEEPGLLPPSVETIAPSLLAIAVTAQTPPVIAVTAEVRHLHDGKGVQSRAIVDPLRVRVLRRAIGIDPGSPLVLEEMMSRPLGNGMIKGLGDVMANGGVIQTRDRGHRSEMTGHIEGEMMTTDRVADVVAVVIRDTGECLPETRPESEV
ncbi:hypothetical protein TGAMA5MH_04208 [Trichoderma gamsii]|uniref:Uncharacterized protein n=1 Tax=Trichoderma gamsii TaxID=398673 RepID=A0A2K0TEI4_9HYPO|nr:hypothetical protein TGAMA5MH_04208 [Trichoderma gamsii]